jgi:hypothetical protein
MLVIDWIADYWEGVETRPILSPPFSPATSGRCCPNMPRTARGLREVLADLDRVVMPGLTHWQSPGWFAFFPANASFPAILGRAGGGRPRPTGHAVGDEPGHHRGRVGRARLARRPDGAARLVEDHPPGGRGHADERLRRHPHRPGGGPSPGTTPRPGGATRRLHLGPGALVDRERGQGGGVRAHPSHRRRRPLRHVGRSPRDGSGGSTPPPA